MAAASKADNEAAADADEMRRVAKSYQYDRYMSALLMPRRHREALLLLTGFGAELQRIPDLVREPMMAAVRRQWWRDALSAMARPGGGIRSGHPFADALGEMMRAQALPFGLLQGMIDSAEAELDPTALADADEVRRMLIKFDGAMFELAGRVLGARGQRETWQQAAEAYGYARLAVEFRWRDETGRQTFAPIAPDLDAGRSDAEAVAFAVQADAALMAVRARYRDFDAGTRATLLPLAVVGPQLARVAMPVQHSDGRPVAISHFARARALLWARWRSRV